MSPIVKRLVGLVVAIGALGAAVAAVNSTKRKADEGVREEARRLAQAAQRTADDALQAYAARLEPRAAAAAGDPRLVNIVSTADEPTLRDYMADEPWWKSFRDDFKITAIAKDGVQVSFTVGVEKEELAADLFVSQVKKGGIAHDIIMAKGWPYAASGATMIMPGGADSAVLVLAKPVNDAVLKELAGRTDGALLLSDRKRTLGSGGLPEQVEALKALVGKEQSGTPVVDGPDGTWAAAVAELAPGLWRWTYANAATAAHAAAQSAATTRAGIWAIAAAVAVLAVFLGFRKSTPMVSQDFLMETSKKLAETQAALERLTQPRPAPTTTPGVISAADLTAPVSGDAATQYLQSDPKLSGGRPTPAAANVFGRYTLLDRLGEGGMAEVYTAVTFGAEGFRRTFVIKRLRPEMARDATVVAQFIDEANLASTLVHSNIVPVFDFGKVGEEYFLAQEYILGRDLSRVTRRVMEHEGKTVPVAQVLFFAHETLKALEYAHTRLGESGRPLGIVHRDVSPNNILVSARGEVKLFDFGIVKAEGRVTKTQHGVVKGNVSFMSPEQAKGIDVDGRADLFSLGLVMYYCLAGDVLYKGNTTYELLLKAATGPGPDEKARIAALPAPAASILAKALATEPAARYQTAHEFAVAIAPHIGGVAAEVVRMMQTLFSDDFKQEEARFAAAVPTPGGSVPAAPTGSGTQQYTTRKS